MKGIWAFVAVISIPIAADGQARMDVLSPSVSPTRDLPNCFYNPQDIIIESEAQLAKTSDNATRANLYRLKSEAALRLEQFSLATQSAKEATRLVPDDDTLRILYARCLATQNQGEKALSELSAISETSPYFVNALNCRAQITCEVFGDPSGCIAQVDAILADSPNFADAYLVRAAAFVRTREFDAALSDVNSFITMRGVGNAPRRESPFLLKAVILFHKSSFTESIAALRIALELHPDSIPATELLWKCYVKVKDPSLAHIAAARLYQIAPSTDSSNRAMGTSLFALKRFGAAVPYLQKCLQDNNSSDLKLLLAGAYFGDGNYAAAAEEYTAILEESPENWKAKLAYAHFLALCPDADFGNPSLAEMQLLDLINDPRIRLTNASLCYVSTLLAKVGNSDRAIKLLSAISNEDEAAKQLLTAIENQTVKFDLITIQADLDDPHEAVNTIRAVSFPTDRVVPAGKSARPDLPTSRD